MKQNSTLAKSLDWKLWIGLLISALFLYLALRKVDLPKVWMLMKSADPFFLLLVATITLFQFVIRAWRWGILLEPIKPTGHINRLCSILIGFAANCVLPARLGEFIRANYLGQTEKISGSSTFGTIVVERLFDGFTLLLVLLIGLVGTNFPNEWKTMAGSLRGAGLLLLLFYVVIIIFLVGFKFKAKPFLELLDRFLFFLPQRFRKKCIDMIWNFSLGLVLLKSPYRWVQAVFFSLFVWFANLYTIQLIEYSLGLTLPFIAAFIIMAMASFGVAIPSAPGFIGTFHLAVLYGFLFYGIGKEEALSAAILWHASFFIPTVIFGFAAFLFLQIRFGNLKKDIQIVEAIRPDKT